MLLLDEFERFYCYQKYCICQSYQHKIQIIQTKLNRRIYFHSQLNNDDAKQVSIFQDIMSPLALNGGVEKCATDNVNICTPIAISPQHIESLILPGIII